MNPPIFRVSASRIERKVARQTTTRLVYNRENEEFPFLRAYALYNSEGPIAARGHNRILSGELSVNSVSAVYGSAALSDGVAAVGGTHCLARPAGGGNPVCARSAPQDRGTPYSPYNRREPRNRRRTARVYQIYCPNTCSSIACPYTGRGDFLRRSIGGSAEAKEGFALIGLASSDRCERTAAKC
uniref:Uncharacterized protein n=1 Tax=Plectus sambesii TaxID=2011161 RepID=A0A914VV02_9BILA